MIEVHFKCKSFIELMREIKEFTQSSNNLMTLTIDDLELSVRTSNVLKSESIFYLQDILKYTRIEYLKMPNFGKKSLHELEEVLLAHNLILREGVIADGT